MKKLFTSEKFFLISVLISLVGAIPFCICDLISWPQYSYAAVIVIINNISLLAFYYTYRKHLKNTMKGLAGFILMGVLAVAIVETFPLDLENLSYSIISLVNLLVILALCINHFIINSDHHSKRVNIFINQLLLIVQLALYIVMAIYWLDSLSGLSLIMYIIGIPLSSIGTTASIVCVESRLDAYRIKRELAGWTEENGYPEGYEHDYKKK